ncbi:hypothetical protein C0Q70_13928 [Pomacea canaliculata]|uniref:Uncharacterized protein n=1 Tax=Pomacea canaliculata TaxID=400727 RepID=A0A2T7NYK4_POMCA|nr:hypothetical protein C0Q70_13928 [Pomacea canaliculata]
MVAEPKKTQPGETKVLDELYRILNLLQQTDRQLPRSHEFLQELRDISSMAMEHFEENVVPRLKNHISPSTMSITGNILSDVTSCPSASGSWTASVSRSLTPGRLPALRQDPLRLQQQIKAQNTTMLALRKEQHEQRSKLNEQRRLITEQERKLQEQSKLIMELTTRAQAQEIKVEMLSRQVSLLTGQSFGLVDSCNLMHQPPSDPLIGGDNSLGKEVKLENANSWGTVLGSVNKDKLSKDYYGTCAEATKSYASNENTCNDSCEINVMNTVKYIPPRADCHSEQGKSSEDINIVAADLLSQGTKNQRKKYFLTKDMAVVKTALRGNLQMTWVP